MPCSAAFRSVASSSATGLGSSMKMHLAKTNWAKKTCWKEWIAMLEYVDKHFRQPYRTIEIKTESLLMFKEAINETGWSIESGTLWNSFHHGNTSGCKFKRLPSTSPLGWSHLLVLMPRKTPGRPRAIWWSQGYKVSRMVWTMLCAIISVWVLTQLSETSKWASEFTNKCHALIYTQLC